ncbi:MAG TPA: hypothetical protein VH297_09600 [Gaiellaceae bacterium]|jgi:hypothetical protein
MRGAYWAATLVFGFVAIGLGLAILVQTVREGGGVGYVIGLLFVGLGAGRLYLLYRRR